MEDIDEIKVLVCDDSALMRNLISRIIDDTNGMKTVGTAMNGQFLLEKIPVLKPDVILLDIEMPDINGVEVAKRIRTKNETVQLVFVTGYSDYIAEGYDVSALHYLLKPLQRDKLQAVISKAISLIRRNEKRLALSKEGKLWLVPLHEINYIDVYTNYVTVHAAEEVTVKRTLSDVEKELDERFFRVGRSLIVNLNKIRKADRNSITLLNGSVVPIPGNAYEHLMRAIIGRL